MSNLVRGLYTAASGMLSEMTRQDVISNNLSNVNTPGFKKDFTTFVSFPDRELFAVEQGQAVPVGGLGLGTSVSEVGFMMNQGPIMNTGNKMNFAIEGDGFFILQTPQGNRYTRNGQFSLDAFGRLADVNGNPIMGENGVIVPGTNDFDVDTNGYIRVDGQIIDRFQLFFPSQPPALQKLGDGTFLGGGINAGGETRVLQSHLEGSNVNAAKEMIEMIAGMRAYQSNQRVILVQDEMLRKAAVEIGRVA